jgi:hypothetical protein
MVRSVKRHLEPSGLDLARGHPRDAALQDEVSMTVAAAYALLR